MTEAKINSYFNAGLIATDSLMKEAADTFIETFKKTYPDSRVLFTEPGEGNLLYSIHIRIGDLMTIPLYINIDKKDIVTTKSFDFDLHKTFVNFPEFYGSYSVDPIAVAQDLMLLENDDYYNNYVNAIEDLITFVEEYADTLEPVEIVEKPLTELAIRRTTATNYIEEFSRKRIKKVNKD